jgi:heptosyltransferase III
MPTLSHIRESALPRLVDQVAGAPLLALWGVMRRRRALPVAPRRIGLMMFETIGDTLLAGTLVASLRHAFPSAELVVFASRGNRGILDLFEGIARVVDVQLTRPLQAIGAMRSMPVDVMIDIGQWPRWYAVLCAASRSGHTIGFRTAGQARHFAYDTPVSHGAEVHELENFQRLLAPLRVPPLPPQRGLRPVPAGAPARLGLREPYLVVHPWASGFRFASREWPVQRWIELIARWCGQGFSVLVSGSPSDQARAADLVAASAGLPVRSLAGAVSLPELAGVLRGAAAAVCVNTGVMHLASVLDVPLVALHGPTSRRRWGPTGARSIALAPSPGDDCEFLNLGFEYPPHAVHCMERISVDAVSAALRAVLASSERRPAASPA